SLGNSVDLAKIEACIARFGLDAFRWFMVTQGPVGSVDSDFSDARLAEVYNTDLANTVGNCWNRIVKMTHQYLGGRLGSAPADGPLRTRAEDARRGEPANPLPLGLDGLQRGLRLVQEIDQFIEATQPFKLARDAARRDEVAAILYQCAETYRIA